VNWSWSFPTTITGMKFQVVQVEDAASQNPSGFMSSSSSSGSFTYQFNQPGTYYYWSGFIDSAQTMSSRGIVVVSNSTPTQELELNVNINQIYAQKCQFPFLYNSTIYTSCIFGDQTFRWCSPTTIFSGQYLPCNYTSKFKIYNPILKKIFLLKRLS
jgi:hypothetical protein